VARKKAAQSKDKIKRQVRTLGWKENTHRRFNPGSVRCLWVISSISLLADIKTWTKYIFKFIVSVIKQETSTNWESLRVSFCHSQSWADIHSC
jgi:hypothetical protein